MNTTAIAGRLASIELEGDPCLRTLGLARLLSELFADAGFRIIVTGGSAIELLTEGRYTSGDLDICFESNRPPLRTIAEIMSAIGASGGTRTFRIRNLFMDILGTIESLANTPFREIDNVKIAKPEDLIPERVLMSVYPAPDAANRICAEKLISAAISGDLPVDWEETERIASLPEYLVLDELRSLRSEIEQKLQNFPKS